MNLHPYQLTILEKMMYNPKLKFSNLQIKGLTSKHFNYHLKKLVENDLLEKSRYGYVLTKFGKDYVSKLDESNMQQEIQPKVSVALYITRIVAGKREYLVTRRLKQPYYGKVGGVSGKVKFGERFQEAAERELLEETGLTGKFTQAHIHHKLAHGPENKSHYNQDNIFIIFQVTNTKGHLITHTPEQENFWISETDLRKRDDLFNTLLEFIGYAHKVDGKFTEGVIMEKGY
ncbi:MAG TPA: NUDIX domain-containing protein [Candidatus Dojkabacteria bacterium]|nr:NUDIX domain-containing protein [Candidatus Dojkabacteria bacterium]